jgi:hypothetical protein
VGSGLIAELAYAWLKLSVERAGNFRLFAFFVPFAQFALFFAALILTTGVWWSVHMWAGVPVLAGVVGLLASFLVAPPMAIERS